MSRQQWMGMMMVMELSLQIQNMHQSKVASPKLSKLSNNASSPTLHKGDKHYLPSRYALDPSRSNANMHTLLNSIEFNTREELNTKSHAVLRPIPAKDRKLELGKKGASEFKPKPMKREENDMQNFKQIFLEPRQQVLEQIKEKGKSQQVVYAKQVCKDYERLLQFEKGDSPKIKDKDDEVKDSDMRKHFDEAIQLLEKKKAPSKGSEGSFYRDQIRVDPPDMPNSTVASTISPGAGYAPSVPLLPSKKATLGQLLIRAKAGMSTEDVQKEAHLAFYLGMVYEEKRAYHSAVRFYKRYLGFAKSMEDKIGMALGANRVGVNLFYEGQTSKSYAFHHQNMKLSDNENCFAAYSNLGICQRTMGQHEKAVEYFETGLEWARQKGEAESECITLGQLAVTYKAMEYYQKAVEHFELSADLCRRLKKSVLLEQNLHQILLITSHYNLATAEKLFEVASEAYESAVELTEKQNQQVFSCNMGIIIGGEDFNERALDQAMEAEFEEFEVEEEAGEEEKPSEKAEDPVKEVEGQMQESRDRL